MCPLCHETLVAFELHGVEIDRCVSCQGIWLDAGELEWIAHLAGVPPGSLSAILSSTSGLRTVGLRCPRCARKLHAVQLGSSTAVEVERCPRGDGFWFDRGEMETFLRSVEAGAEGAVARFLRDFHGQGEVWNAVAAAPPDEDRNKGR